MLPTPVAPGCSPSGRYPTMRVRARNAGLPQVATGDSVDCVCGAAGFPQAADPQAFSPVTTMSARGVVGRCCG